MLANQGDGTHAAGRPDTWQIDVRGGRLSLPPLEQTYSPHTVFL